LLGSCKRIRGLRGNAIVRRRRPTSSQCLSFASDQSDVRTARAGGQLQLGAVLSSAAVGGSMNLRSCRIDDASR
jgi:hypothetical protein